MVCGGGGYKLVLERVCARLLGRDLVVVWGGLVGRDLAVGKNVSKDRFNWWAGQVRGQGGMFVTLKGV